MEFDPMLLPVVVAILTVVILGGSKYDKERPQILRKLSKTKWFTLQPGTAPYLGPIPSEIARATGYRDGRRVEVWFDYIKLESNPLWDRHVRTQRRLVTGVELPQIWEDVRIWPDGLEGKIHEKKAMDSPIGDEGFDREFFVSGHVGPALQEMLLDPKTQRKLRDLGPELAIKEGLLQFNEHFREHSVQEVLERLDELSEAVQWFEQRQDEILDKEDASVQMTGTW